MKQKHREEIVVKKKNKKKFKDNKGTKWKNALNKRVREEFE